MMLATWATTALSEAKRLELAVNFPPSPVEEARRALDAARAVGAVVHKGFTRASHGIDGFSKTVEQKAAAYLTADRLERGFIKSVFAGAAAALGIAAFTRLAFPEAGYGLAAAAGLVPPLVAGLVAALSVDARVIGRAQALRCVDAPDVAKLVRKLDQHTGFERAVAGSLVEQWRDDLKAHNALTASAELLLTGAAEAMRPADAETAELAQRLAETVKAELATVHRDVL